MVTRQPDASRTAFGMGGLRRSRLAAGDDVDWVRLHEKLAVHSQNPCALRVIRLREESGGAASPSRPRATGPPRRVVSCPALSVREEA